MPPIARTLGPKKQAVLESLYRHRLMTTRQIGALHFDGCGSRRVRAALTGLAEAGLAAKVKTAPSWIGVWYLTPAGMAVIGRGDEGWVPSEATALGPLQRHTLAVTEVGLAFLHAARRTGGGIDLADWDHEVNHRIADTNTGAARSSRLVADALVHYTHRRANGREKFVYRFIEVDRCTETLHKVTAQLRKYVLAHRYTPRGACRQAWRDHYPVFPAVIVVLTGSTPEALGRRRDALLRLMCLDELLDRVSEPAISICTLDDLTEHGPLSHIFWKLTGDGDFPHVPCDLFGLPARSMNVAELPVAATH